MKTLSRIWAWVDDRSGVSALIRPMASHLVPPGSRWWYVFGSATLFAFLLQVVTGIALTTLYLPSAGQGFESVRYITEQAPFGWTLRGIHFFGASAMVLFAGIHMVRVFMMGSYKFPRELNWLTGVALLLLTVSIGFTGQVLRWDQNAIWSAVVGSDQASRVPFVGRWLVRLFLSGDNISGATLSHFFTFHVFILPGLLGLLVALHLGLVLRHGISEPPVAGRPVDPGTYRRWYADMLEREGLPFWPYAAWRDAVFGACMAIGVVVLAVVCGPPAIGLPPDPSIVQAQPKPDWYLMWYFALLALLPRSIENVAIITLPLTFMAGLFAVPFLSNRGERSWRRRPWASLIIVFCVTCVGALWIIGEKEPWSPAFHAEPLTPESIGPAAGLVHDGGQLFNARGCLACHTIDAHGGSRGPDLSAAGDRLTRDELVIRILNGGDGMPAYARILKPEELEATVAFLLSRKRVPEPQAAGTNAPLPGAPREGHRGTTKGLADYVARGYHTGLLDLAKERPVIPCLPRPTPILSRF